MGLLSLAMVEPTILMEAIVTHIELHRVFLDTMDTMAMAREKQSLAMDMVVLLSMPMEAIVILIEVHKVSMDTMDMDMELPLSMSPRLTMDIATTLPITTMVTVFTRGLQMLSQDMVMLSVILIEVHKDSMDTMV